MTGISVKPNSTRIQITFGVTTEHVTADEALLLADALVKAVPDHAKMRMAELDDQDAKLKAMLAEIGAERDRLAVLAGRSSAPAIQQIVAVEPTEKVRDAAPAEPVEAVEEVTEEKEPEAAPDPAAATNEDPTANLTIAQTRLINHYLSMKMKAPEIAQMVGVPEAAVHGLDRSGVRKRA